LPVCSYVVVPHAGEKERLRGTLSALAGCDVVPAINADLLLLVTTTPDMEADAALRRRVEALPSIQALLLTFGEVSRNAGDETVDGASAEPATRMDESP